MIDTNIHNYSSKNIPDDFFISPWLITWCKAFPLLSLPSLDLFFSDFCQDKERRDDGAVMCGSNYIIHQSLASIAYHSIFSSYNMQRPRKKFIPINTESLVGSFGSNKSLEYGEILAETIIEMVAFVCQQEYCAGGKVVDLGSGNGNALFASALIHPFDTAVGIEVVSHRHEEALRHLSIWNDHKYNNFLLSDGKQQYTNFTFLLEDFSTNNFSIADANLVIIHATAFEDSLMACVERLCVECATGTWFIMVSKPLGHWINRSYQHSVLEEHNIVTNLNSSFTSAFETWKVLDKGWMDWGQGTIYIQRRV